MALKLVPFNPIWVEHDKLDLHGIYRRPRYVKNDMDEDVQAFENGVPQWDVTTPLPIKLHNRWTSKGFQYITLADRESLREAAKHGTLIGGSVRDYDQHQTGGPWFYKLYVQGQTQLDTAAAAQLRSDVERFGADAVESIRRQADPNFRLPPELRGTTAPEAVPVPEGEPVPPPRKRGRPRKAQPAQEVA